MAYRRLNHVLGELGDTFGSESSEIKVGRDAYTSILLDAWTIVDTAWRLKRFLLDTRLPRPAGSTIANAHDQTPAPLRVDAFNVAITGLKKLRDGFQHLDNQVTETAAAHQPIWGIVNWATWYPETRTVHSCCLVQGVPGTGTASFNLINPVGKAFHSAVDHVTLTAFDVSADLSEIYRTICDLTCQLERALRPHTEGLPHGGDSFIVGMVIQVPPDNATNTNRFRD